MAAGGVSICIVAVAGRRLPFFADLFGIRQSGFSFASVAAGVVADIAAAGQMPSLLRRRRRFAAAAPRIRTGKVPAIALARTLVRLTFSMGTFSPA